MALRLLGAGFPLAVWNRTQQKMEALVAQGARAAVTASDAASNAQIVITMLTDGAAVADVLFESGVASVLEQGAIVIDASSIPPPLAQEHARRLHERGIHHLDAPVSGGTRGAAEGTLAIMVGGVPEIFERAHNVLECMGRPTHVGPSGSGQLAKLANQAIVAVTIGAVAEALLLATAGGADPAKVTEALAGGFADSAILRQHGRRMLDRAWVPGGHTRTQVKDLRAIGAMSKQLGLHLPLAQQVAELFEASLEAGRGAHDHSSLLLEIESRNPGVRVGSRPDQHPVSDA
jgi:2-hydroxy-3-oxopropionate reductase